MMAGEVPLKEMSEERRQLLAKARANKGAQRGVLLGIIEELVEAASACPRIGCATCSFMTKHERAAMPQVGEAEAG